MAGRAILDCLRRDVAELEETGIALVAQHGWGKPGLVPMWFGEGDQSTPGFICDAAAEALRRGETFYTDQRGILPVREALVAYTQRTFGVGVSTDEVRDRKSTRLNSSH